ncbi:DUF4974 domain-containing protein [Chitinophaga sp. SYP-B3965]|uniref:FecR domain-containing protein n=1 Tax=Chitinophaga sp. SYP-B3965 TaxID=2663120 RepID=UPI001299909B|nr:FecR domain-containing protein [Chitinophaga sp. SYP-B3965]MRG49126.1 DUF4974 domain-containing protein [Chitinophaga sp. SYP-B3965]
MSINQDLIDKIVRLMEHPEDETLRQEIDVWRAAAPENEVTYREYMRLWDTSATLQPLAALRQDPLQPFIAQAPKVRFRWIRYAAAAVVLGIAAWFAFFRQQPVEMITLATKAGQTDSIRLADGSRVILAENTTLRYPATFSHHVTLENGKAFFDIAPDPEHKFMVNMPSSSITVLGTSFNIEAGKEKIAVNVSSGKIRFEGAGDNSHTILEAGKALVYDPQLQKVLEVEKANPNENAWATGELIFEDASLAAVCQQLEKTYEVKIVISNNISTSGKLNVKFSNSSLQEVLDVLEATYPIKISKQANQQILITRK